MDPLGLKAAIQELEKQIGPEQSAFFNRLDLTITNTLSGLDALLAKYAAELKGLRIVISFEDKP